MYITKFVLVYLVLRLGIAFIIHIFCYGYIKRKILNKFDRWHPNGDPGQWNWEK